MDACLPLTLALALAHHRCSSHLPIQVELSICLDIRVNSSNYTFYTINFRLIERASSLMGLIDVTEVHQDEERERETESPIWEM